MIVGARGNRLLGAMAVEDAGFRFSARFWVAGDMMCCPSAEGEVVFEFDGKALQEVSGHWRVEEYDAP